MDCTLKQALGILTATGKINRQVFREIAIFFLDEYPDLPRSTMCLNQGLAEWILSDAIESTKPGVYRLFPNYWITEAEERTGCILMLFTDEEQFDLHTILLSLDRIKTRG